MNLEFLNIVYFAVVFLLLFGLTDVLHLVLKIKSGLTRKIVHVATGLIVLLFPFYFESHLSVLVLCASFFVLLILSMFFNFLPSINKVERKTIGSLLFPVSIYIAFYIYTIEGSLLFYILPMAILGISDTLAELVGSSLKWKPYKTLGQTKTLGGSITFFISSFLISLIVIGLLSDIEIGYTLLISFGIALITTVFEAFSHKGFYNLTIPLGAILMLYFVQQTTMLI
jgi:dolichol kinase